ncbi:hypothetical protein CCAN11_2110001 [Capnocytophaga canimorsus]|uniref:Uncharacterized protein n=1 Tax=Capnocytophaga canimorsus TaxID=28188 RepID=A0A0B7IEQ8_9FLAO|nr:hypothetical protein CCAN11_2110001 [Capnocytophaga canimorsus]
MAGCSERLLHWRNWLYAENFLIGLKKKAFQKRKKFPNQMEVSALKGIKTLRDFDEIYTSKGTRILKMLTIITLNVVHYLYLNRLVPQRY